MYHDGLLPNVPEPPIQLYVRAHRCRYKIKTHTICKYFVIVNCEILKTLDKQPSKENKMLLKNYQ